MPATTRAVVDASCVLRAVLDEAEDALEWLDRIEREDVEGFAPDLLYAEVAQGLVGQVRSNRLTTDQAVDVLATVAGYPLAMTPARLLMAPACAFAIGKGVTAYDGHYLVLARAEDAVLVTADRELAAAATNSVLLG